MGKHIVYHYHENAFAKDHSTRHWLLPCSKLAHEIICVSEYQASFLKREKGVIVATLYQIISQTDNSYPQTAFERKQILMLGSLKLYKSPLSLSNLHKNCHSLLLNWWVNDTQENIGGINGFMKEHKINICKNLTIYPQQNDVVPFYNQASLVLNLSDKKQVVETFGLTALKQ